MEQPIKLIECPRDAMQGRDEFVPTADKVAYINQLLSVGFDTIDFGSFVSPKAIPQMRDTAEVLKKLNLTKTRSKLLAIVANGRGIDDACSFEEVDYLGFPFSISEEFQQRNTKSSIDQSLSRVEYLQAKCSKHDKQAVIYISMAFGNPYGEPWHPDVALKWSERLVNELDIKILAMSDTIGVSTPTSITQLFDTDLLNLPCEIGAHLHTTPDTWLEKITAAYEAGCRRFDGALKGFGGCPMAKDELTGNMPTEQMIGYLEKKQSLGLDNSQLAKSLSMAAHIFA